jgi:hypothetical protein
MVRLQILLLIVGLFLAGIATLYYGLRFRSFNDLVGGVLLGTLILATALVGLWFLWRFNDMSECGFACPGTSSVSRAPGP